MSQIQALPRLTKPQVPQVIAMLGRAFHHDPLSVYLYSDEAERTRRLPLMFQIALRYTWRYGAITIMPEITGAACWLPPEQTTLSTWQLWRSGALTASLKMGWSGLQRLEQTSTYMLKTHEQYVRQPHWYLWVLGVEPTRQGQSIGGTLLRAGLARADAAAMPCYLETMNPENVPLYQKFGFVIASEGNIPGSSVRMWGMIRPACAHTEA